MLFILHQSLLIDYMNAEVWGWSFYFLILKEHSLYTLGGVGIGGVSFHLFTLIIQSCMHKCACVCMRTRARTHTHTHTHPLLTAPTFGISAKHSKAQDNICWPLFSCALAEKKAILQAHSCRDLLGSVWSLIMLWRTG